LGFCVKDTFAMKTLTVDQMEVRVRNEARRWGRLPPVAAIVRQAVTERGEARPWRPAIRSFRSLLARPARFSWSRWYFPHGRYLGMSDASGEFPRFLREVQRRVSSARPMESGRRRRHPGGKCYELACPASARAVRAGIGENGHLAFNDRLPISTLRAPSTS
jgi:hypothetical protein